MKHKKERFHRKTNKPKADQSIMMEKPDKSAQNNSDYESSDEINELDDGDEDEEENEVYENDDDDDEEESLCIENEQTDKKKIENSNSNFKFQTTQTNNLTLNINLDMNKNISNQYSNNLNETKQLQQQTGQLLLYQFDSQKPSFSSHNAYFSNTQFDKNINPTNMNNMTPSKLLVQNSYKFIDQSQPHLQQTNFGGEKVPDNLPVAPVNNQDFFNYTNQNLFNTEYDRFQAGTKYNQYYQQQQSLIHDNNYLYALHSSTHNVKNVSSYQEAYPKNSFGNIGYYGYDNNNYYSHSHPNNDVNSSSHGQFTNYNNDSNHYYFNGANCDPNFNNQIGNTNNSPRYLNIAQQKI